MKLSKIIEKDFIYKKNEVVNNYLILDKIGEGRYGIAYLAKNPTGDKVILKQLKKKMLEKSKYKIKYETEILKKLNEYKQFPSYIGDFVYNDSIIYVLEYIEGKTFYEILYKDNYIFTKDEIFNILEKILNIIKILNENKIVHKDIRINNVILKNNGDISLIDFGLARYIDDKKYKKEIDYWYIADYLIHLYYSSYEKTGLISKPWYEELNISVEEILFLKKLMGIDERYSTLQEIENDLSKIKKFV